MPNLTLIEGLYYAKRHGGIVVLPNFESATGYCVSECIRHTLRRKSVSGNVDHLAPANAAKFLAEPTATQLASALAKAIEKSPIASPQWDDTAKEQLGIETVGDEFSPTPLSVNIAVRLRYG